MDQDVQSVLVTGEEIDRITQRLADQIWRDYHDSGRRFLLVIILKGAVPFAANLMNRLSLPLEIDFMKVSSYGSGTVSSGNINIQLGLQRKDLTDTDLLIVEDIVDSGRTLSRLIQYLKDCGAHSVKTCTLLDKPSRREVDFVPDYCGKEIPDCFVIGYGLDYNEKYRNLPYIGILKPEVYEK